MISSPANTAVADMGIIGNAAGGGQSKGFPVNSVAVCLTPLGMADLALGEKFGKKSS